MIQTLHALVMSNGKTKAKATAYRTGQNVIRESGTKKIVYMPPEAKDVPMLMKALVAWINNNTELPCPILAAIAHYQFATIHPYYDGNGRTARLLTTLLLHLGEYDLKGLYSLEEYYARILKDYYEAISISDSHNYYMGRSTADITKWIDYFIEGMAFSFEKTLQRMYEAKEQGNLDYSPLLKSLDPLQRKSLVLFQSSHLVTSRQIGELFGFKPRTSTQLCANWVKQGFFVVVNPSNKRRTYTLAEKFTQFLPAKI